MANDWEIKSRSTVCTATGRAFADGDFFYTLLFLKRGHYLREDLCEEAWQARDTAKTPYSFWRSRFEIPPPEPEPLDKQDAETLLRRYMAEPGEEHANVRYFLALMLERKRLLKPVEVKEEEGKRLHIYLHVKSGEVFVIPDPQLRLDELEAVQAEVVGRLNC